MPLSEHEERILAEIERQLAEEDPRFVARARRARRGWSRTVKLRLAIALGIIGFVCLLGLTFSIAFGAAGMVLLMASILLGVSAVRERDEPSQQHVPGDDERS